MDDVVLRPFRPGDERAVNDGFNRAFNLDRSLDEWSWKFPPRPGGRLIMLAEREGEVLAHYAGYPVRFAIDGRQWPAAQIVDVYSARSARTRFTRRGVWVRTVEAFFDTFGRTGRAPMLFGFPSPRPLRLGVLQLGYDAIEPQPIRYLRRSVPARHGGNPVARALYRAELAADWEPRLDRLWQRARGAYPVAAVRDAEHALHRLAGHPTARYHRFLVTPRLSDEPVAWAAFRSDDGRLRWVDLVWDHDHPGALSLLSHLAARLAVQAGAAFEELWLNNDPAGQARLVRHGFEVLPEPLGLVMVAKAFDPALDLAALDGRVYLTMADADLV